jgi:phosphoacetylglucosamine mutase
MGILVAIRAKLNGSAGMMITASHNPKDDNGIKVIEHNGDVLPVSWEQYAE